MIWLWLYVAGYLPAAKIGNQHWRRHRPMTWSTSGKKAGNLEVAAQSMVWAVIWPALVVLCLVAWQPLEQVRAWRQRRHLSAEREQIAQVAQAQVDLRAQPASALEQSMKLSRWAEVRLWTLWAALGLLLTETMIVPLCLVALRIPWYSPVQRGYRMNWITDMELTMACLFSLVWLGGLPVAAWGRRARS